MADLFRETADRVAKLRRMGYTVTEKWGCDWLKELASDKDLAAKVRGFQIVTPLSPRDALAGGRTNALKLIHDAVPGQTVIRYYDFKV